jgi:hypothetical protein
MDIATLTSIAGSIVGAATALVLLAMYQQMKKNSDD